MRWDDLFDDLESQLEQGLSAEQSDILAEEERLRLARLGMKERIAALAASGPTDRFLRMTLIDGSMIRFRPSASGRDWFSGELLDGAGRYRAVIVPLAAIGALSLDLDEVASSLDPSTARSALAERLGLGFVLRDLCRRRVAVELWLTGAPSAREPVRVHGTIDRVGRDHLDLALHDSDRVRRSTEVTEYRVIALAGVVLVRV